MQTRSPSAREADAQRQRELQSSHCVIPSGLWPCRVVRVLGLNVLRMPMLLRGRMNAFVNLLSRLLPLPNGEFNTDFVPWVVETVRRLDWLAMVAKTLILNGMLVGHPRRATVAGSEFNHPTKALAQLDLTSAFNEVGKSAVQSVVRRVCPSLTLFVDFGYSEPSFLQLHNQRLNSRRGVQQGDPLGLLFSIAIHVCILVAQEVGLNMSLDKCVCHCVSTADFQTFSWQSDGNVVVLGLSLIHI
eukprot:5824409-Amphidinium_carterae.1